MINVHPEFLKDADGKIASVVLPVQEFEKIMEELEELEDVKLYDEAKKEDTGERILFSDYLKIRKNQNV